MEPDGKRIYPEMARDAVLFGGTDPGRFCPTYMIFCESFIPGSRQTAEQDPYFDRRDVYIITQNALANPTYLDYIRAQYFRSAQIDPPFFQNFLSNVLPSVFHGPTTLFAPLDYLFTSLGAQIKGPPHGTSWFKPDHFTNVHRAGSKIARFYQQDALAKFLLRVNLAPRRSPCLMARRKTSP